jgi:hypothetical protein
VVTLYNTLFISLWDLIDILQVYFVQLIVVYTATVSNFIILELCY